MYFAGNSITLKSQEQSMTEEQKMSYAIGHNTGEQFAANGIALNAEYVLKGLNDALEGKNQFTQEEMGEIFNLINRKYQEAQNKGLTEEKSKGQEFLDENRKKEGVVETPSGLQYKVVKMGDGPKPKATDRVRVHYHGTTLDGKVFDSSVLRGETITFGLNQVIRGWTEGVQLMPVGSKFIFYIPSDLAYGDRGAGSDIKPGATLIFEVELFEINPQ